MESIFHYMIFANNNISLFNDAVNTLYRHVTQSGHDAPETD